MSWLLYKTNRFHFAVGLYSDNVQRTSKRGENISHATRLRLVAYFFVLTMHVLTSSVRYQSTDARQNGIYLLTLNKNIRTSCEAYLHLAFESRLTH